jgi:hypothetical protein
MFFEWDGMTSDSALLWHSERKINRKVETASRAKKERILLLLTYVFVWVSVKYLKYYILCIHIYSCGKSKRKLLSRKIHNHGAV